LDVAGVAAFGGLVYLCFAVDEYQGFLYEGGFAVVGVATAVLISALIHHPRTHTKIMDLWLLRWIGVRSYGIYLWHWPIYMVTRPELDVPLDGPKLLAVRLVATLIIADLSYRLVETPIRHGALGRRWRTWRSAPRYRRRRLKAGWTTAAVALVVVSSTLGAAVVRAEQPENPVYLSKKAIHTTMPQNEPEQTIEKSQITQATKRRRKKNSPTRRTSRRK